MILIVFVARHLLQASFRKAPIHVGLRMELRRRHACRKKRPVQGSKWKFLEGTECAASDEVLECPQNFEHLKTRIGVGMPCSSYVFDA